VNGNSTLVCSTVIKKTHCRLNLSRKPVSKNKKYGTDPRAMLPVSIDGSFAKAGKQQMQLVTEAASSSPMMHPPGQSGLTLLASPRLINNTIHRTSSMFGCMSPHSPRAPPDCCNGTTLDELQDQPSCQTQVEGDQMPT
jgi:hypothetical protein